MENIPSRVRNDKLWRDIYAVVEFMYEMIDRIIEDHPNEQWATASKLRNSANDSLFYASQAIGSASQEAVEYEWNSARKNLFSLQTMYTFAAKQKFIELEPDVIVKIDNLLTSVDKKISASKEAVKKKNEEDLKPWLEKYQLWQKIQEK